MTWHKVGVQWKPVHMPYNKRGPSGTFALTISDAYHWHRGCPCAPADHPHTGEVPRTAVVAGPLTDEPVPEPPESLRKW